MSTDEPWLKPQQETDQQKAERKRRAQEAPPSARHAVRQLDELKKASATPLTEPPPAEPPRIPALARQGRVEPTSVIRGEDPQPVSERPTPAPVIEPSSPATAMSDQPSAEAQPGPDPRLVEIARTWAWLSERDREELLLLTRVKYHLNQKPADR
jgi:hypothetical protein